MNTNHVVDCQPRWRPYWQKGIPVLFAHVQIGLFFRRLESIKCESKVIDVKRRLPTHFESSHDCDCRCKNDLYLRVYQKQTVLFSLEDSVVREVMHCDWFDR